MTAAVLITPTVIQAQSPALFALAYRLVRERAEAEDLVQETWVSALRSAPSFEQRSSLRTWLFSILRRRIADSFRRKRSFDPLEEERHALELDSPEDALDTSEAARLATLALGELGELERRAVVLCDIEDVDRDAASQQMGVTRGHLRVLLHRGRHKLEASLAAHDVQRRRRAHLPRTP